MSAGAPRRGIAIPAGGTVLLNHAYSTIKVRGTERRRCAAHAGRLQLRLTTSQADSAHPLHALSCFQTVLYLLPAFSLA